MNDKGNDRPNVLYFHKRNVKNEEDEHIAYVRSAHLLPQAIKCQLSNTI